MSVKKKFLAVLGTGFISGFGLIAYAHVIPGVDKPFNPAAYYTLTQISWADSPSPYALKDLASNGGSVFDYTRYIKSILFGDKFEKLAETDVDKTKNDEINSTPFSEKIFAETMAALKIIGIGTEKVARTVTIDGEYLENISGKCRIDATLTRRKKMVEESGYLDYAEEHPTNFFHYTKEDWTDWIINAVAVSGKLRYIG